MQQATAEPPDEDTAPSGQDAGWPSAVLAAVWQSLDTPMAVVGSDLRVLMANPAGRASLAELGTLDGRLAEPGALDDRLAEVEGAGLRADGVPLSEARRPVRRALLGETVREEEYVLAGTASSQPRRFVVSAYPFVGPDGERLALSVWRDVTARWQQETQRQQTLARLHQLMAGAADYAIMMLDGDGRVLTWSQAARALLRIDEQEILGQHFSRFFLPLDREAGTPEAILRRARTAGRAVTQGRRLRGDGSSFWARGVVTAQYDDGGAVVGFVEVTHDVTDEHLARQEVTALNDELRLLNQDLERRIAERTAAAERQARDLADANRELEAFSYSVSHDLRAPLRAMAGFARILTEEHSDQLDDDGLRHLGRIQTAAAQMAELIEGLLAFSRVQRQAVADDELDMTVLARDAWASVASGHPAVHLELEPLPGGHGDRRLVIQVWVNLLENAVKFSSRVPQPRVRVWAERGAGTVTYCVADNGAGFDPEQAARLFVPFNRLHRSEDFPGTGVGLALVHRILHRHGGSIVAVGVPGGGATFRFTLGDT